MEPTLLPVNEHISLLLNGNAHDQPCDSCQPLDLEITLPPWFNKQKYKRGQDYIWKNLFAQFGVTLCGLVCVLSVPSILRILISTKKSSTPIAAYRRYLSTIKHVYSWYSDDLEPGTTAWKSLMTVRARHLRASKTSQRNGGGHISQRDLVLTQFSFYGFGFLKPRGTGMQVGCAEEVDGYLHFWRTIGYMMGIDDRYNICRPSVQETREVSEAICKEGYCQLLRDPPEYFFFMVSELIKGMWNFMPLVTVNSFLFHTYCAAGVEGFYLGTENSEETIKKVVPDKVKTNKLVQELGDRRAVNEKPVEREDLYQTLSWYDRFIMALSLSIFSNALTNLIGRIYFNTQIKISMFLVTYFPFLVLFRFGIRNSYVDMFAEDKTFEATLKSNKDVLSGMTKVRDVDYGKVYSSCTATVKVAKSVN